MNRQLGPGRTLTGLIDAGAAALASLVAGIAALRYLGEDALGAHALEYAAALFASAVLFPLVFIPALMRSTSTASEHRMAYMRPAIRTAWPTLLLAAALIAAMSFLVLPDELVRSDVVALALVGAVLAFSQPLQLYTRQLLHYASRSSAAAGVSTTRVVAASAALLVLIPMDLLPIVAVPLASLCVGNLVAVTMGFGLARAHSSDAAEPTLRFSEMVGSGARLAVTAGLPAGSFFIVTWTVSAFAGPAALGLAEAARVAAQPVGVAVQGISAVENPIIMEGAQGTAPAEARRAIRRYTLSLLFLSVAYGAALALPEELNPVRWLMPRAFEEPALLAMTVVAALIAGLAAPWVTALTAERKESAMLRREGVASLMLVALGFTAASIGAFARPVSVGVSGAVRATLFATHSGLTGRSNRQDEGQTLRG